MKVLHDIKLFDFENNNVKIGNAVEDILNMLNSTPIPVVKMITNETTGETFLDAIKMGIVGAVVSDTVHITNDGFVGDIYLTDDDNNGEFVNYLVDGEYLSVENREYLINKIIAIQVN